MKNIEVKILSHNLNGMPQFLAMLTQRGSKINSMKDIEELYNRVIDKSPSEEMLKLPHSTIRRMNYITVAIVGLSTKAVSQIRTHATRMTFMSTSTQYSEYSKRENNYVIPEGISELDKVLMIDAYEYVQKAYKILIDRNADKDKVGYLLPQGLRKAFIMHGNLDAWEYILSLRLCRRNTEEVQLIMKKIFTEINKIDKVFATNMMPPCYNNQCLEGRFCCGKPLTLEEVIQ